MPKSTTKQAPGKPAKPRPDFPLFPHATGRWAKKVRGRFVYFGKTTDDPKGTAALKKWFDEKDALLAGRRPRAKTDDFDLGDLCNQFLAAKKRLLNSTPPELSPRMWAEYYGTCERLTKAFGADRPVDDLAPDDFERLRAGMTKAWGAHRVANEVQRVRTLFRYGYEAGLIDRPVRYGPAFKKPSRKTMRLARAAKGSRMLESAEIRELLEKASVQVKAMILLAMNCGFGNGDCAALPLSAVNLERGWIDFPRPKSGIPRRCPLWPETMEAIRATIAVRSGVKDQEHKHLIFVTKYGAPWIKGKFIEKEGKPPRAYNDDAITKEFKKLLRGIGTERNGLSFYSLRHIFETVAGNSRDQVAVDAIMGHARDDMASLYRERIDDARLQAVVDHVRGWLFGNGEKK